MSQDDQARWDEQHAESAGAPRPASFLRQVFETDAWQLPRGRALDIACGKGRNSLYLAELGFEVVAMDISAVALDEGRQRAESKRLHSNLSPPLEAGTIRWGFQRGRASPLVASGVQTPFANSIDWRQTDLEDVQLDEAAFDLIVNFNYLQRSLMAQIKRGVKAGGHVIFETYLIDQKELGHPTNPNYLLRHNELLEQFRDFRVLYYREGKFSEGGEASYRAGILARRIA